MKHRRNGCCLRINCSDEAVAPAGDGFHIRRSGSGIAEGLANFVYCRVEAVIEINEGAAGPEFAPKVFAREQFARTFQQKGKELKWLFLKTHTDAILAKFPGSEIGFENSEADNFASGAGLRRQHSEDVV